MLKREQCIKLKEWGFPQMQTNRWYFVTGREVSYVATLRDRRVHHPDDVVDIPDLGAMILWLGDKFNSMDRSSLRYKVYSMHVGTTPVIAEGATPDQAVYALCEAIFGGKQC